MFHSTTASLAYDSTLADLPMHDFSVTPDTWGNRITAEFDTHPDLPGVIVTREGEIAGLISREKFLEHLSRPFALELYMKRPIEVLLVSMELAPLVLPASTRIAQAADAALKRTPESVFEPLVVRLESGELRLLSMRVLQLAQSQLLALANQIISRQRDAADAANSAKSQFLANMSHEIRTPMNGIIGLTEILLETPLSAQQREYMEMVRSSADWLVGVINDVLDFSKIEAGKLELERTNFHLRDVLRETLKPLAFRANKKSLKLSANVHREAPDALLGDPTRLRQVITNLVGNALKFTSQGGVTVTVAVVQMTRNDVDLEFSVADTGVGIPADRLEKIFSPFEQADGSTTRRYGGTGLGLSISQRLTEMMGGRIWVESREGGGSTFFFTARLTRGVVAAKTAEAEIPFARNLKILLAEDNAVNQKLAVLLLEKHGHRLTVVENGREALAACLRESFDMVLMDVQMPVMDGLQATLELRKREQGGGRRVPIIAMTAHALKGDRERCLAAGMDGYVPKPIRSVELYREIALFAPAERVTDSVTTQPAALPPPAETPPKPDAVPPKIEETAAAKTTAAHAPAIVSSPTEFPHAPVEPATARDQSLIDWTAALSHTGGDPSLLRSLVEVFLNERDKMVDEIRVSLSERDAVRLRRAGHSLKSSCGYFAAVLPTDLAARVEQAGVPLAEAILPGLEAAIGAMTPELCRYM